MTFRTMYCAPSAACKSETAWLISSISMGAPFKSNEVVRTPIVIGCGRPPIRATGRKKAEA